MALAVVEWMQMANRIRAFPIVVLTAVLIVALVIYLVSRKREPQRDVEGNPVDAAPRRDVVSAKPTVQAPPPTNDPGQKILEGADGAFRVGQFPTALKFYKDFELRYAGTEVYDRNLTRLWERIHSSNASSSKEKQEPDLPAYLETRRKLADEWKRLKPLTDAAPTPESKAEIEKFLQSLPPQDGRRKIIDAWRDGK
jgi:hypothetical protein